MCMTILREPGRGERSERTEWGREPGAARRSSLMMVVVLILPHTLIKTHLSAYSTRNVTVQHWLLEIVSTVVAKGWGREKRLTTRGHEGTSELVEMFYSLGVVLAAWLQTLTKMCQTLYFKNVYFAICKLYLNIPDLKKMNENQIYQQASKHWNTTEQHMKGPCK